MSLRVGIVRDEAFFLHETGADHPERALRLKSIYNMLDKEFVDKTLHIVPEPATLEQIELVHSPSYVNKLFRASFRNIVQLAPDTPASRNSLRAAWFAAGGCIKALKLLWSGRCDAIFSLVRPPGHHATRDRAGGYCILNNIAITAQYAITHFNVRRILIVDWDINHGNGIQDIFYDTEEVLYFSTHNIGWYPYTGKEEEIGYGPGLGFTVNVPINKDVEDVDLLYIYWKILPLVFRKFRPELIIVAAGFDGHNRDPEGRTKLTEKGYKWITELLLEQRDAIKSPPILFVLEGGFDPAATTACVKEVLDVLTFVGRRQRLPVSVAPKSIDLVDRIFRHHRPYRVWMD